MKKIKRKISEEEMSIIFQWGICDYDIEDNRYKECENCNRKKLRECLENADDNRIGYKMFCDCIVGCGYDSMDDFWECNGI